MKDLISVIIPVYNGEKYIEKCLNSVINQTYDNLEIIIINDGSTDNTKSICENYLKKDQRIRLYDEKNMDVAYARNKGIKIATGEYITFVDSDDTISLNMYKTLIDNIHNYDADLAICDIDRYKVTPKFTETNNITMYDSINALKELLKDEIIGSYSCNKLIRTSLIKNIKYPLNVKQEDVGTIYKFILNAKTIVYSDSKLYGYFTRDDSKTRIFNKQFYQDYLQMVDNRAKDLKNLSIDDYLLLSKCNVILGMFISLAQNNTILKEKKFKYFVDENYKYLKINYAKIKKINTRKKNTLISLLLFNKKLFYITMNCYLNIKGVKS